MKGGNLDDIEVANRYFKYECSGLFANNAGELDANKTLRFTLPPLSSIGFSNNYNQCLVKIRKVIVGDNGNFNPVWANGTAALNFNTCAAGIIVQTNIPCRNFGAVRTNNNFIGEANLDQRFGATFAPTFENGVIVSGVNQTFNGELPNLQTCAGAKKQIRIINGLAAAGDDGGIAGGNKIERSNGFFIMEDTTSIFDTGMLCGVPFGNQLEVSFKEPFENVKLGLVDYSDTTTFIGGVSIVFEFLMLPNPTP